MNRFEVLGTQDESGAGSSQLPVPVTRGREVFSPSQVPDTGGERDNSQSETVCLSPLSPNPHMLGTFLQREQNEQDYVDTGSMVSS